MLDKDIKTLQKEKVVTHGESCVFIGATMAPSWGFVMSKQEKPDEEGPYRYNKHKYLIPW